ncbi:MAG: radical SAM protein [Methanosarcinales archaeon]
MHIPINVSWDISTKCNLKCKHSSFYSDEHIKEEVSSNDVFKIIKRLEEVGVLGVALLGGEPLLRKDIFNVISELKKRNMLVSISTNGSFTKNKSISLVNALRNVQIDNVQVSLENSNKIIHEFIRGKDTYEKTIYFIKLLRSKSINSHISMTVGKHNIKEIDDTIKLSKNLGVGFRYTILLPIGRANKYMGQFLLDNKDFKYIVDRWRFWKENYPKTIIANDPTGGCPVNLDRYFLYDKAKWRCCDL